MRRFLIATTAAALLVLGACGGETTSGSGGPSSTAASDPVVPGPPGTASGSPGTSTDPEDGSPAGCVATARDQATEIATRSFPDNADETWTVADVVEDDEGRAVVEIVPGSAAVGYPRFRFVTACEDGDAVLLATYALDEGTWTLLFTSDAAEGTDFDPELAD